MWRSAGERDAVRRVRGRPQPGSGRPWPSGAVGVGGRGIAGRGSAGGEVGPSASGLCHRTARCGRGAPARMAPSGTQRGALCRGVSRALAPPSAGSGRPAGVVPSGSAIPGKRFIPFLGSGQGASTHARTERGKEVQGAGQARWPGTAHLGHMGRQEAEPRTCQRWPSAAASSTASPATSVDSRSMPSTSSGGPPSR